MRSISKLICWLFGHKVPAGLDDLAVAQITSSNINGFRYATRCIPCERCILFFDFKKYTDAEWQKQESKYIEKLVEIVEDTVTQFNDDNENIDAEIEMLLGQKSSKKDVLH